MDVETQSAFFRWCTTFNEALLIVWTTIATWH